MADKVSWLPPFESSNLAHVGYNHDKRRLLALFRNGNPYLYHDVPVEIFNALHDTAASEMSVGKAFNELVKGGDFRFEQLTPAGDPVPEKPERVVRGAPVGMLWYDNSDSDLIHKCENALDYRIEKYGSSSHQDHVIFVNPEMLPEEARTEGIVDYSLPGRRFKVIADPVIMPNYFLVCDERI